MAENRYYSKAGSSTKGNQDCLLRVSLPQAAVTGVLSAVYVATMHPSLPGGDAGELIVAADEVGVAHPPGYPLYTLMMKAFFLLVPWGSVAWRANLLTSLLAAAGGGFLCQAVLRLTDSLSAAVLAAGMFGFSRLTWTWSVTAEVFALNDLLVAVLMYVAVCFHTCRSERKAQVSQVGALVCGLCLSNQHTSVVYVAVLVPWVIHTLHSQSVLSVRLLVRLSLFFSLGLLPYLYLPLCAMSGHARWTWGDQSTVSGFLTHLLRREYGTLHLLKDHEGQGLVLALWAYIEHVVKDLTPAILFFFATTIFSLYIRWRDGCCEMLMVMLAMFSTYTLFFAWRANLDIDKPLYRGVVERFWLQSDLLLVAIAAMSFSDVVRIVNRLIPLLRYHFDLIMTLGLVGMQVTMNLAECDQSMNTIVEDFARATLKAFPPGSIVLTKGDLPSNSLRYYHLTEGVRPDLALFDQEVLTYRWSIPMLRPHLDGIVLPGNEMYLKSGVTAEGRQLFTFKDLLDANYAKKPIFGCIGVQEYEPSWQTKYEMRPFGVCMQFIKKDSKFKVDDWLKASEQFAADWPHSIPTKQSTWEEVASAEMWKAKTEAGLYLLNSVDKVKSRSEKAKWLRHAHRIYKDAIETHPYVPGYWHKNFALVCEKLRHVTSDSNETIALIRTTIAHFKAYLDSDPNDPQASAIEKAIEQLQQYIDSVTKT